jgi:hypothetical protein
LEKANVVLSLPHLLAYPLQEQGKRLNQLSGFEAVDDSSGQSPFTAARKPLLFPGRESLHQQAIAKSFDYALHPPSNSCL